MMTMKYTIRRPGHAAWVTGLTSYEEAVKELRCANDVCPGHMIIMEDDE